MTGSIKTKAWKDLWPVESDNTGENEFTNSDERAGQV